MKTFRTIMASCLFPLLAFEVSANYIYHWIPGASPIGPSSGFIEISDPAYASGSFTIADIIDFEFIEPPFFAGPNIYGQTTWDIVLSATGDLTADKQSILTMTLTSDYSTPPAADSPPRQLNASSPALGVTSFRSTSPYGVQAFNGTWGDVTYVSTSVAEGGSTAGLLALALGGIALLAKRRAALAQRAGD